jgi:hypothetical protein
MKKTLQDQYLLIKEGKGHVGVFLTEAKRQFPNIVRNAATLDETVASLKSKNIISENVFSVMPEIMGRPKKESYETAFEAFLAEAKKKNEDEKVKAEEKKVSKPVEEDLEKAFDYSDEKNPDNMIFDQIMTGYYAEMKDPKNADKTMQQLKDIVFKNLEKDPIYYTKNGQFGVKDLGYVTEAPGLGEPKEPKGKYKSSGYGDLKEGIFDRFKSKPLGDVESAKEFAIKNLKDWLVKNLTTLTNRKDLTDDQVIALSKAFAERNPKSPIAQLWKSTQHLFEANIEYYDGDTESDLKSELVQMGVSPMVVDSIAKTKGIEGLKDKLKEKDVRDMSWTKGFTKEEQTLREVIREMIDAELEEAYQLVNQGINSISQNLEENTFKKGDKVIYLGNPAEITFVGKDQMNRVYYSVSYDKGNGQTKATNIYLKSDAIKPLKEGVLGVRDNDVDYNTPLPLPVSYSDDKNVAHYSSDDRYSSQEDLLDPEDYFENIKDLSYGDAFNYLEELGLEIDEIETILNSLSKSSLREGVEKDLADINKEAEHEVLQAKLDKIDALIDHRRSKLLKLDEDEDMKALTDKKKVKELEKDIKKLEVARKKVEKMVSKFKGKKSESKEVIDETENDGLDQQTVNDITTKYNEIYIKNGVVTDREIEDIAEQYPFDQKTDIMDYLEGYSPADEFDM